MTQNANQWSGEVPVASELPTRLPLKATGSRMRRLVSLFLREKVLATLFLLAMAGWFSPTTVSASIWTVTNLHPEAGAYSSASSVSSNRQVGWARVGEQPHASMWNGTAESWQDLHPVGVQSSWLSGIDKDQQVGTVTIEGEDYWHAGLWHGSAESWIDLNPDGALASFANGTNGEQQIGEAAIGKQWRAVLWNGSAESWIDLTPAGSPEAHGYGIDGGMQVGWARVGGVNRASLWNGTSESWVDLNPIGSIWESIAVAISGGQQVGYTLVGDSLEVHASLWNGTAESWIDLNPLGTQGSLALGVRDGIQVGSFHMGNQEQACLWRGTAESMVNLHQFLPANFLASSANSIWSDKDLIHVVGYGYNTTTSRYEALMWTSPVPEPNTAILLAFVGCFASAKHRRSARLRQSSSIPTH